MRKSRGPRSFYNHLLWLNPLYNISCVIDFLWLHEDLDVHQQVLDQGYLLASSSIDPPVLMLFQTPTCQSIRWVRNAILRAPDDVILPLGLGYSAKANAGLCAIWIFQAQYYTS
jgi:hypothetical protein